MILELLVPNSSVPEIPSGLPKSLGFKAGVSSVHTSRTMMLGDLSLVLEHVDPSGSLPDYLDAIIDKNVLGKATRSTRLKSSQRLIEEYSLDKNLAVFRLLRHYWTSDKQVRPMLAYLAAMARDPLLRDATPFVISTTHESTVTASDVADFLSKAFPGRFKATTLESTAQNLASSWAQAGFLKGRHPKTRIRATVSPVAVTYALALGYLCGARGKLLLDTLWVRSLDRKPQEIIDLVSEASKQGWLRCKSAGSVVEITFPHLLTPQEEQAMHEPD